MRKKKKLGKGRNNNGTKEKQTALRLVHPCGLLYPAGGDSGTHQQLCRCLFIPPICKELGFELGKLTMYRMLYCISSALALPFVATSFRKHDVRIVISIAAVIYGGCAVLMGGPSMNCGSGILTGIIQGIASSFVCMIPAPIILGNWFKKKDRNGGGNLRGVSRSRRHDRQQLSWNGDPGIRMEGELCGGWNRQYRAGSPDLPVRSPLQAGRDGTSALRGRGCGAKGCIRRISARIRGKRDYVKELLRQPEFYIAVGAYWTSVSCAYLNSFLTPCGIAAGLTLQAAAMMTSISLLGNMSSKLILGKISDSLGIIKTFEFSIALAFFGHVLLFIGSPKTVMAGSLFFGVTLPLSSVMMPLFCRIFWKGETYSAAYAYSTMVGTLLGAPFNMWFGTFYDITGDYRLTIGVSAVMLVMLTFLIMLEGTRLKRMKSETSPSQAR